MRAIAVVLLGLAGIACVPPQLTPAGGRVEVVTARPGSCKELGVVVGSYAGIGQRAAARALVDARNRTAERGGTHLVMVGLNPGGDDQSASASGLAYRCGPEPVAEAAPPVPRDPAVPAGYRRATITSDASVRSGPDRATPELFRVAPGTRVVAYEHEMHGHRRVRTEDGRTGFVDAAALELAP